MCPGTVGRLSCNLVVVPPCQRSCYLVIVISFRMNKQLTTLDWNDTFLDEAHLMESFPNHNIELESSEKELKVPPYVYVLYFVIKITCKI